MSAPPKGVTGPSHPTQFHPAEPPRTSVNMLPENNQVPVWTRGIPSDLPVATAARIAAPIMVAYREAVPKASNRSASNNSLRAFEEPMQH